MFSSRDAFENDFCPVRDELLGQMYRANANGLPVLVDSVSSDVRAMLALFCYRRSHLHSLALAIAASCTERELIQLGGRVGSTLYALSREPAARSAQGAVDYFGDALDGVLDAPLGEQDRPTVIRDALTGAIIRA